MINFSYLQLSYTSNRFVGFNQTTFQPIFSSLRSVDISMNVSVCRSKSRRIVEILGDSLIYEDHIVCSTSSDTLEPLRDKPISNFKPIGYCGLNKAPISSPVSSCLVGACFLSNLLSPPMVEV